MDIEVIKQVTNRCLLDLTNMDNKTNEYKDPTTCEAFTFRVPSVPTVFMSMNRREAPNQHKLPLEEIISLLEKDISIRAPWTEMTQRFLDNASYCAGERKKLRETTTNHETQLTQLLSSQCHIIERLDTMEEWIQGMFNQQHLKNLATEKKLAELLSQIEDEQSASKALKYKFWDFEIASKDQFAILQLQFANLTEKVDLLQSNITNNRESTNFSDFTNQLLVIQEEIQHIKLNEWNECNVHVKETLQCDIDDKLQYLRTNLEQQSKLAQQSQLAQQCQFDERIAEIVKTLDSFDANYIEILNMIKDHSFESQKTVCVNDNQLQLLRNEMIRLDGMDKQLAHHVAALDRKVEELQQPIEQPKEFNGFEFLETDPELDTES